MYLTAVQTNYKYIDQKPTTFKGIMFLKTQGICKYLYGSKIVWAEVGTEPVQLLGRQKTMRCILRIPMISIDQTAGLPFLRSWKGGVFCVCIFPAVIIDQNKGSR